MDFPAGLGERGLSLWESLKSGDPARDALALEAARLSDRLDELDSVIQGKGVLNLMQFRLDFPDGEDEPFVVEVKFQNVLAEARQQALALSGILGKLGIGDAKASAASKPQTSPGSNVTPLDRMRNKMKA